MYTWIRSSAALAALALLSLPFAVPTRAQEAAGAASFEVHEATIAELQAAMDAGHVTAVALVDAYLARIRAYDGMLTAIIVLNPAARSEAASLDEERSRRGPRGSLHGIPILLKDNFDTSDLPTTGASVALRGFIPPDDATIVRKLREAGAIVLGKTNLHELAAGITTISSLGGQTKNPYDPTRNPGGSSGGTGAAIAASFAAIGYGTDTCGSIRIPASSNALFGLRPTKGLVSMDGVIPLSHTQDIAGPLTRTVADLAVGLDAIVGGDPADPSTRILDAAALPRFAGALDANALRGARIGVLAAFFGDSAADREAAALVRGALERMRALGADVRDITVPGLDTLVRGASVIDHEFKFDLMDYLARAPDPPVDSLGDIVARGLHHEALAGTFRRRNSVTARETEAYQRARARQALLRETVVAFLEREGLDALAYPAMRRQPAPIGEPQRGSNCQLSAVTGTPALAMPAGFTADDLPIGLELLGRPLDDAKLVGYAYAYEQAVHPRRPPALTPPLAR
jgi:Asp-tRNA(Asn)/Glu-tRNA(Gln) amidotransferase A subunit family amidase